ncbi:MAG TPA: hypothetical protein VIY51_22590 [Xanthobacteraceae bacterium]
MPAAAAPVARLAAAAPKKEAAPIRKPALAAGKRGGGPVGRMQAAVATAMAEDQDWKEF